MEIQPKAQPLSANQRRTGRGRETPEAAPIWCPDCQMMINGRTQWEDHIVGKKHKRKVKKNSDGTAAPTTPLQTSASPDSEPDSAVHPVVAAGSGELEAAPATEGARGGGDTIMAIVPAETATTAAAASGPSWGIAQAPNAPPGTPIVCGETG